MDFITVILIIGAVQGIFLITALIGRKVVNRVCNILLAVLLFAITTYFTYVLVKNLNGPSGLEQILKIHSIALGLLIGPAFFLFVRSYLQSRKTSGRAYSYHFLPYILLILTLSGIEWRTGMVTESPGGDFLVFVGMVEGFKTVHIVTYLTMTARLLLRFGKSDKIVYQGNSREILFWFKGLLILFILTVFASLGFLIWAKFLHSGIIDTEPTYVILLLFAIVYAIAYMTLRFPLTISNENGNLIFKRAPKYQTSSLSERDKEWILGQIRMEMETSKPYLDDQLTLEELAKKLQLPAHHISQTINQLLQKSFNDFINEYRVQEFKQRILAEGASNKTILAIAYESGFASKSSFNRIFKLHTALTPNEYKKMH